MAIKSKKVRADEASEMDWPFGRKNYLLFGVALVVIIVGYICLAYGDDPNHPITLTLAPILLVAGYLIIPFAIMVRDKAVVGDEDDEAEGDE